MSLLVKCWPNVWTSSNWFSFRGWSRLWRLSWMCGLGCVRRDWGDPCSQLLYVSPTFSSDSPWSQRYFFITITVLKILPTFFVRSNNFIFQALRKHYTGSILSKTFCAAGKFFKNRLNKVFLALFGKFWPKSWVYYSARFPLKIIHFGFEGVFREIWRRF